VTRFSFRVNRAVPVEGPHGSSLPSMAAVRPAYVTATASGSMRQRGRTR
jgi:hypothetical protein